MSRPSSRLTITAAIIAGVAIAGYAYFAMRSYLAGPQIEIFTPGEYAVVEHELVEIRGVSKRISSIKLNDRPIFVDESGEFREQLLLYSGYNILKVAAQDRYGRIVEKKMEIILRSGDTLTRSYDK